jgi:glycosyltransferase involved in cell wall biosynthesis
MRLGLLPALGGGIRELARTGQVSRLVDGYLRRYVEAFDEVVYFSYLPESLEEYTPEAAIRKRARILSPPGPLPRGQWARRMVDEQGEELRRCHVLRVFQVTGVTPLYWAAGWRRKLEVPFVTTYGFSYAALSDSMVKKILKQQVEKWALRNAAAVIATTAELKSRALEIAPRARVELIPNGVDTARFVPGGRTRVAGGPLRVLYVGRLSREKNVATAVQATTRLGVSGGAPPSVTLVVIGEGPLEQALREQAREADVVFRGVVDQRDLPAEYAAVDAFVLPSFTEGHPKALIEAMSCGLPCVVSSRGGNLTLVEHEVTGLLFDAERPDQLAACLERLRDDPALAARLGAAAREHVVARYDLGALVVREIALLKDVARSPEPRAR